MSETRFPPHGTKCTDCDCCLATVYAGNAPICWECDEGVPCKGTKRPIVDATEIPVPEPTRVERIQGKADLQIARVLSKPVAAPKADPLPDLRSQFDRDEPNTSKEEKMPTRISEEIRQAIQSAPDSVKNTELQKKFNLSSATVSVIRRGLTWDKKGSAVATRGGKKVKAAKRAKVTSIAPVHVAASAPGTVTGLKITISAEITEGGADSYWRGLTLEQKAAMIQLQMAAILDRAREA